MRNEMKNLYPFSHNEAAWAIVLLHNNYNISTDVLEIIQYFNYGGDLVKEDD